MFYAALILASVFALGISFWLGVKVGSGNKKAVRLDLAQQVRALKAEPRPEKDEEDWIRHWSSGYRGGLEDAALWLEGKWDDSNF